MSRQADNEITFSFDNNNVPSEEALQAEIAGTAGTSTATEATNSPATSAVAAPDTEEKEQAQSAATEEPATKTHTIKVNGQEYIVTEKDLLDGHMRLKDYTQKTQKLAEMQREWETTVKGRLEQQLQQREQELASIDQFLQSREAIEAYVKRAFGAVQQAAAAGDPVAQSMTPQQVADIARYNAEQVRLQMRQEFQQQTALARQEQAEAAQRTKLEADINAHVATILDKLPVLKKYDGIEDELMADAAKRLQALGSRDIDDAKRLLSEAADRKIAWAKAIASEEKKQAAVASAKLTKNGIEPPGGTGIKATPARKLSLDTKDRNDMIAANVAELEAFMKGRQ